jgi:hypothetical protein
LKGKIFVIILLFCFVAPVATTYVFLQIQKKQVRKTVKRKMLAGIDKETLVLFKFTEREKQTLLHWKHAKEFEYSGEMYDIVESEVKGDTTYYWCFRDHEETQINRHLADLIAFAMKNNPLKQENQKRLSAFFKSLYVTINDKQSFSFYKYIPEICFNPITLYQSQFYSPPVPPPKGLI